MDDRLMTIKQLASYLKLNERTIAKLVADGALPGAKIGNQWRFRKAMIDTWHDDQMLGVAPRFVEEQKVAAVTDGEVELDSDAAALLAWRDGRLRRVSLPGFRLPFAPVLVTCGASTDQSPAISGSARSFFGGKGD